MFTIMISKISNGHKQSKTSKTRSPIHKDTFDFRVMSTASVPARLVRFRDDGPHSTYIIGRLLGRGGFGTVYEAQELESGLRYALKAIPLASLAKHEVRAEIDVEIEIQQSLDHPNVLKAFHCFEDDFNFYLLLELCPYASVRKLLGTRTCLSESETADIMQQTIEAVVYLHQNLVIHRDLKLENFLIAENGIIKIADFGISRRLKAETDHSHSVCGTVGYISPEMLTRSLDGHGFAVDVWALGVCAFTLLTGRTPFETRNEQLTSEYTKMGKYQFPRERNLSFLAKDFIQSCLQTNPESRPTARTLALHPFLAFARRKPSPLRTLLGITANESHREIADIPSTSVAKYCDHRQALGYLLVNGTIGAVFQDGSRLAMDPYQEFMQFWRQSSATVPEILDVEGARELKPVAILFKFKRAFSSAERSVPAIHFARDVPMAHVKMWMRGQGGILFCMSDETIQLNCADKQKLVVLGPSKQVMLLHGLSDKAPMVPLSVVTEDSPIGQKFRIVKDMVHELNTKGRQSRRTI
jgi:polo-like kinase 1